MPSLVISVKVAAARAVVALRDMRALAAIVGVMPARAGIALRAEIVGIAERAGIALREVCDWLRWAGNGTTARAGIVARAVVAVRLTAVFLVSVAGGAAAVRCEVSALALGFGVIAALAAQTANSNAQKATIVFLISFLILQTLEFFNKGKVYHFSEPCRGA